MKTVKIIGLTLALLLSNAMMFAQDQRTLDTKVADILAQMPVNNLGYNDKIMADLFALGNEGLSMICDRIVPPGTGDDTNARFAIESLSRFLTKGRIDERKQWEKLCLSYAVKSKDSNVKDFFFKQLQSIGSESSIESLEKYLTDKVNCHPVVAVITAIGGEKAEKTFAAALKNTSSPCAASMMNALAEMKSSVAVDEYIMWSTNSDNMIKASAYNALANSADAKAYKVLAGAAKNVGYRWEVTGATASFINYAGRVAEAGNMKTMDKICKLILKKCNTKTTVQYRVQALDTYVRFHGMDAMPVVVQAASNPDFTYASAAVRMTEFLGKDVVQWMSYYPKTSEAVHPEIIRLLGRIGDRSASAFVISALKSDNRDVRIAASEALVKLDGNKAISPLVDYMKNYSSQEDQQAVELAVKSCAGNAEIEEVKSVLKDGNTAARKTAIELLAWNDNHASFDCVFPFASSDDEMLKDAACKALVNLSQPQDQQRLISLFDKKLSNGNIVNVQKALINAANQIPQREERAEAVLSALKAGANKEYLLPVLAGIGGYEALLTVLKEFENGGVKEREWCFNALTDWCDYSASSALYEICASGNKTYESKAFNGYVKQVRTARVPDEQKLLLLRKIMPYAFSADRKNAVIAEIGKLKTYQALFFVSRYLDDVATSAAAAQAVKQIALPAGSSSVGLYGTNVKEIITKAIPFIKGSESDYDKEKMSRYLENMPQGEGFVSMFNGKDLTGWKGLVENPVSRAKMKPAELAKKQAAADKRVTDNWSVKDGCIWFNGSGDNLCSVKEYEDFELLVDWKITKEGDSGIYLRGTPQVQIWDTSRVEVGAQVGSGGLYNNAKNPSNPLKVADNLVGEWNTFRIIMTGEKVSVWLNGELVVDNVVMENYWDRSIPIFPKGAIELQAHGTNLAFRDIYVREISASEYNLTPEEKADGFVALFNGKNLDNWVGNKVSYGVEDGMIVIKPKNGGGGNLYTAEEYSDFNFRFEFQLTPNANNGLGIRAPLTGDAAYVGMELQILDNDAEVYSKLHKYQYHGSIYGVVPAKRGFLKPVGEWNSEEVIAQGTRIKVILNGTVIVDADIADARDNGTMDNRKHPGLKNTTGHIGFLGHGSIVRFRNIRIKEL